MGFSGGTPGLKPWPGWGQRLSMAIRHAGRALAALGVDGSTGTQHGVSLRPFSEAMAVTTPVCVRSRSAVGGAVQCHWPGGIRDSRGRLSWAG